MRIAFFVHGYLPWDIYGVPRYVENLANYLVAKGHKAVIFCVGRPGLARIQETSMNVKVYRSWYLSPPRILARLSDLWSLALYTLWCCIAVPDLIDKEGIDVIHGHTFEFGGIQSLIVSFMTRRKCIVTFHGTSLGRTKFEGLMQKIVMSRSSLLICLNEEVSRRLIFWGFRDKFVLLRQYNVDTERFKPRIDETSEKPLRIIFVGRLSCFKAPDLFVEAASTVLTKIKGVTFYIIGDGEMKNELETLILKLRMTSNIHILGFENHMEEWYSQSDIYVACSPYENFPSLSLLEAMASGLAVVATDVGETSTLVKDGQTGLLAAVDPQDIARNIILLVTSDELRKDLGHNARLEVEKKSLMALGSEHERIYSNIVTSDFTAYAC